MIKTYSSFSLLLGLTDFVNPIFYTLFFITILKKLKDTTNKNMYKIFKIGALISLIGGYIIPTGKVIVGLGLIDFVMPVPIVHIVNTGFLISGVTLFLICLNKTYKNLINWIGLVLIIAYIAGFALISIFSKYNTAAVITGVIGIFLIYISMIIMSKRKRKIISMILAIFSFIITIFLAGVGIKADLYSPTVHWIIELTNIICQCSLFLSAKLLFKKKADSLNVNDSEL